MRELGQVGQRGGRCPIPGNIQGWVGQGSELPDLVKSVPAHHREVGLAELLFWFRLPPVTKSPRGRPSPPPVCGGEWKEAGRNWWVGIRAV